MDRNLKVQINGFQAGKIERFLAEQWFSPDRLFLFIRMPFIILVGWRVRLFNLLVRVISQIMYVQIRNSN